MIDLVSFLVKSVLPEQSHFDIDSVNEDDKTTVITVKVCKEDLGKVIGRGGKVASAIRTLLRSAGQKEKIHYVLKIVEAE